LTWDGTTDAGTQAPDGHYELRVTLAGGRNVTIPDPIVIDTVPPTITLGQVSHSPTGLTVHYARSKGNGHAAILVLRGSTVVLERRVTPHVFRFGYDEVPPGRYTIALVAIDQAGNRTPHPPSFPVTVP